MAPRTLVIRTSTIFLLLWLSAIVAVSEAAKTRIKEIHMVFYLQDLTSTNKAISGSSEYNFGDMAVIDDAVTQGPDWNSAQMGRAQGFFSTSALDGSDFLMAFSIIFTNAKYNGSTLEIQGADRYLLNPREVAVVSGTGAFRFARGYAVLETASLVGLNTTIKYSFTIRHY